MRQRNTFHSPLASFASVLLYHVLLSLGKVQEATSSFTAHFWRIRISMHKWACLSLVFQYQSSQRGTLEDVVCQYTPLMLLQVTLIWLKWHFSWQKSHTKIFPGSHWPTWDIRDEPSPCLTLHYVTSYKFRCPPVTLYCSPFTLSYIKRHAVTPYVMHHSSIMRQQSWPSLFDFTQYRYSPAGRSLLRALHTIISTSEN